MINKDNWIGYWKDENENPPIDSWAELFSHVTALYDEATDIETSGIWDLSLAYAACVHNGFHISRQWVQDMEKMSDEDRKKFWLGEEQTEALPFWEFVAQWTTEDPLWNDTIE